LLIIWVHRPHPTLYLEGRSLIAKDLRINERIRVREVLIIDDEGQKLGVMPIYDALNMARERGLDLVEVAPNANPPVCRILDYGKFKYEQSKKERDARKHQHQAQLREVRFKPKIGTHDIDFKTKVVQKLLQDGDKVKVSVMFRGREITHPEIGRGLLMRVQENLKDVAVVERQPSMEGRFMNMYLAPVPVKQAPKPKAPRAPKGQVASSGDTGGETALGAALTAAGAATETDADKAAVEAEAAVAAVVDPESQPAAAEA
jgi:translation initiation factor IF-3